MSNNKILIPAAIVAAGVIIAGSLVAVNLVSPGVFSGGKKNILSSQEAAEKVIKYINEEIFQGKATATLINVVEEGGLYKVRLGVGGKEYDSYVTQDGAYLFPEGYNMETKKSESSSTQEAELTIGNFSLSQDEVCKEQEKPLVYFFGSESCPHCQWEKPILERVVDKFKDQIVFRNNIDNGQDQEVFNKYSTGGIPTLVFGCKYYRVGSGEGLGEGEEEMALTALACKLTGSQPAEVCSEVQELIGQVK